MKKTAVLLAYTALVACNQNNNPETKNSKVLLAENVQSIVPLDSFWNYNKEIVTSLKSSASKYDKEKIFSFITHAVLSGRLKAYTDFPSSGTALTIKEFSSILVKSDTMQTEYPGNPGGPSINAITEYRLLATDITHLKFDEVLELDTLTYRLNKRVTEVAFFTYKQPESSESPEYIPNSYYELFYVKLND